MKFSRKKSILIVSYYLPPIKTVGTVRIFNFHLESQKFFEETFSVTTSNRHLFPSENYPFDDSKTKEIWTFDLRRFFGKNKPQVALNTAQKKHFLTRFFIKISYTFPFNILLNDGGLTYIIGGFFQAQKLIKQKKIKYLFSSYHPYADHFICYLLKIRNPQLFWIADFRDLPVDRFRKNTFFPSFQNWINRQILKKANVVTTVSKGLAQQLQSYHTYNICVLKNGISSIHPKNTTEKHFKKFTISYTGSLYPEFQSAKTLFKLLKKWMENKRIHPQNFKIIYAGKDPNIWQQWITQFGLETVSEIHGFLPMQEANLIQRKSHLNLLLSWSAPNHQGILTAKFYEYVATKNPILAIINGSQDQEFETIFQSFSTGLVTYENKNEVPVLEHFILNLYQNWQTQTPVENIIPKEFLEHFYWDKMMEKFIKNEIDSSND